MGELLGKQIPAIELVEPEEEDEIGGSDEAVSIDVENAAFAVGGGEGAGTVLAVGGFVIIVCSGIGTAGDADAQVFAGTVLQGGDFAVIVGLRIRASGILTRAILFCRQGVEVDGISIGTAEHFLGVTDAIPIDVGGTRPTAFTEGIGLISVAVAIAGRDVRASTIVDGTGPVADATVIVGADAVVDVVADSVSVHVGGAVSTANAEGIELVAIAVAIAGGNIRASTIIDGSGPIADATVIVGANAVVHVVADSVTIGVS